MRQTSPFFCLYDMKLELPKNFSDLDLRGLQAFQTEQDPITCISAVTGLSREAIRKMPQTLVNAGYVHIKELLQSETARHLDTFTINGTRYGFIPNWDEFTVGEWIDLETQCADFWPNAHKVMAILFRPVNKEWNDKYTIEPYTAKEDAEVFLDMPADQVAGALLFFSTTRSELLNTLRSSLIQMTQEATSLLKNGVGTQSSMNWRTKIYWRWMMLRSYLSGTCSRILPSSKT